MTRKLPLLPALLLLVVWGTSACTIQISPVDRNGDAKTPAPTTTQAAATTSPSAAQSGSVPTDVAQPLSSILTQSGPSIVRVRVQDSEGTGFVVFEKGYVLTAFHVVSGAAARPKIVASDGQQYEGVVFGTDESKDLALVLVPGLEAKPLRIAGSVAVGDSVIAIGHAAGIAGDPTVTKGIVSAVRSSKPAGIRLLQTDAPVNPGNSGGPLLNGAGEVVGLISFKLGEGFENLGFAIAAEDLVKAGAVLKTGAVVAASTPTPVAPSQDRSLAGQVRYIANTDGSGIRLRSGCTDNAIVAGGWAEGTKVVIEYTISACPGWFVVANGASEKSWVRASYLSDSPPPAPPTAIPQQAIQPTQPALNCVSNPSSMIKTKEVDIVYYRPQAMSWGVTAADFRIRNNCNVPRTIVLSARAYRAGIAAPVGIQDPWWTFRLGPYEEQGLALGWGNQPAKPDDRVEFSWSLQ